MREIIVICILGVATLFGFLLWLSFIAGKGQEHINPDIYEAESSRAWTPDVKEKSTCECPRERRAPDIRSLRGRKSRPVPLAHKHLA